MNTSVLRHCREAAASFAPQAHTSFATKWRTSFAVAAAWLAAVAASHAAPAAFSYQGVLRAENGGALASKNQTVEFRLYAQAEGGSPIWGRAVAVLLDETGLFNAELSDAAGSTLPGAPSTPLAAALAANKDNALYIGIKVSDTSGEIVPRQKVLPVPYAMVAADASSASGDLNVAGRLVAASAEVSDRLEAGSLAVAGSVAASSVSVSGDVSVGSDLTIGGEIKGDGSAPVGVIILWSGAVDNIPSGWALCDGQTVNGHKTPDLRNRFVVGAGDQYAVNATGGEEKHTLTIGELPAHSHSYQFKGADLKGAWDGDNYFYDASGHYSGNGNTRYTDNAGGGGAHENRPPYYALCYIMRVR